MSDPVLAEIATEIWSRHAPSEPPETAEERAALDSALIRDLNQIEDANLRGHANDIIKRKRADLYGWGSKLDLLTLRVERLEKVVFPDP